MADIIRKKRNGEELSVEEIEYFISGLVSGEVPDYQAAAFMMAVYFKGMNERETTALTLAMRDSGEIADLSSLDGIKADKHSSGGVGDSTTFIVAPIAAANGLTMAKMSGRGLGHTGGTVDKLETIPGLRTELAAGEFIETVRKTKIAVIGQSGNFCPADKIMYALRDVTATIDSTPLIASSIMSKKLASGADVILLDVKFGSGSFLKTPREADKLAGLMVRIGKSAGKRVGALITNMDVPLGTAVGNTLEMIDSIDTLKGGGEEDKRELCLALSSHLLFLAGKGRVEECRAMAQKALDTGEALSKFRGMVKGQGGDIRYIDDTSLFPKAPYSMDIISPAAGYIYHMNTEAVGLSACLLGAGRQKKTDVIDLTAGIRLLKKTGEKITKGERLAVLYASDKEKFTAAEKFLLSAYEIKEEKPVIQPLVYKFIG